MSEIEQFIDNGEYNLFTEEYFNTLLKHRNTILKEFAKAYLAETKFKPSEVVMFIQNINEENGVRQKIWFEHKESE